MVRRALGKRVSEEKPRILIDCIEFFHFLHVGPLVDRLIEEGRVTVYLLKNPTLGEADILRIRRPGLRLVSPMKVKFLSFDVTISLDFSQLVSIPSKGTWAFLPHGDGMKAHYTGSAELGKYDTVFALTRSQARLQRSFINHGAQVVELGLMIGDRLTGEPVSEDQRRQLQRKLGLKPELPVVLYAPSWSIDDHHVIMNHMLLQSLMEQDEFNVILKPHPNLLIPERCGGRDWVSVFRAMQRDNFVAITDRSSPVYEFMPHADVLLSDISSVVFEFLFLDKPIVLHLRKDVLREIGGEAYLHEILPSIALAEKNEEVLQKLREEIRSPHTRSGARRRLLEERFFNVGHATERTTEWIYSVTGA